MTSASSHGRHRPASTAGCVLSTAATPTSPPAITRVRPTSADELVRGARADHQAERERQHRRARLQRAVAVRELQELREGEDRAHHREEHEPDAERGDGEARVGEEAQRQHRRRRRGAPTRRTARRATSAAAKPAEHERVGPAARRGLDDRVDERDQRRDGQAGADEVERARLGVAALGHEHVPGDERDADDRHVEPEHGAPREPLEQQAADERAEADADARDRRPDADRLRALLAREDVHDHRQRRGHDHRPADAHRGRAAGSAARSSARARRARSRCRR